MLRAICIILRKPIAGCIGIFIDEAKIFIKSGDGGNGSSSFRREKYVPAGGPDGGDGGNGGDILFVVDGNLSTLIDFKYRRQYEADRGEHGQGSNRHGKNGRRLTIQVPPGTQIWDEHKERLLADLTQPGQEWLAAKGGRGGRGNTRFKSSTRQAPAFFEKGEEGEELWVRLELKILADIALVGFPNAGKSTLISAVSKARPKVADYPFTTLVPNLGVVSLGTGESFVIADIPGLIEGAHEGVGLGHEFLRHIERSRVLLFVVDASGLEGRNPVDDMRILRRELELYQPQLAERPAILFANKTDLSEVEAYLAPLEAEAKELGLPFYSGSAATGEGLDQVVYAMWRELQRVRQEAEAAESEAEPAERVYTADDGRRRRAPLNLKKFKVLADEEGYTVRGDDLERLMRRLDLESDAGMRYLQQLLGEIGVYDALQRAGAANGDTVKVGDLEFEYYE